MSKLYSELRNLHVTQFYSHFQYSISWHHNKVSWCYIENDHKIESTEDCTTRIITWTHFNLISSVQFELLDLQFQSLIECCNKKTTICKLDQFLFCFFQKTYLIVDKIREKLDNFFLKTHFDQLSYFFFIRFSLSVKPYPTLLKSHMQSLWWLYSLNGGGPSLQAKHGSTCGCCLKSSHLFSFKFYFLEYRISLIGILPLG